MMFNPILPVWLLSSLLIAMTVAFVWMENSRALKHKLLRIAAVCLMMISVAGLCLRPQYQTTEENNTVLLTDEYSTTVVDSLLKKDPSLELISTDKNSSYKNSTVLASYQQLNDPSLKISTVIGSGIPDYALESVRTRFKYYPSKERSGVTSLYLPLDVQRNNEYHIQGSFNNVKDSVKLFLERAGSKIDSVQFTKGLHHFDLKFTPRVDGNVLYHLRSSSDSIARPIPINVNSEHPLNILVLQGYPTFEIQYLKNFLSDRTHHLALRYQLSKGIFRYEYANRKSIQINRLNQAALGEFDLLISDVETLSRLSAPERGAVKDAIRHGMGFLAVFSGTPKAVQREFLPVDFRKVSHDTTVLKVGASMYTLPAVPVRPVISESISSMAANRTGTLNGFTYEGRGRIGFQLLQETYRLLLSGDSVNYGQLWSPLIDGVARTNQKKSEIHINGELPVYADEPFNVTINSTESKPSLFADSIRVPLIEDEAIDNIWHARLWAGQAGWHEVSTAGDTAHYYVCNDGDWNDLRASSTVQSNRMASSAGVTAEVNTVNTPYPPIYFYLMFVISAGALWLAPKL